MSASTRSRLNRQANGHHRLRERNPAAGLTTSDANPAAAAPARRSKRLRHDDIDAAEAELLPTKRRRRSRKSGDGERGGGGEDVGDTRTAEITSTESSRRVEIPQEAADDTRRTRKRHAADAQTSHETERPARRRGRPRSSAAQTRDDSPVEPEQPEDVYDVPASPPASRGVAREPPSTHQQEGEDSDGSDELFVRQETDEDEGLYDEATEMQAAAPDDEEQHEDAPSAEEEQALTVIRLRNLVVDLGPKQHRPSAAAAATAEDEYPDDHFIFHAPTGHDRVTKATLKSAALKHMVELMSGIGWARRSEVGTARTGDLRSNWSRPFWDTVVQLKSFWENMPVAPQFAEQCDYLHADDDEEAAEAKAAVKEIDEFVRRTHERSQKLVSGHEEIMRPKPSTVDLYEKIIPLLVYTIYGIFRRGLFEKSSWRGSFTKATLQIMERLLSWVERLYTAMMHSLGKRPRDQTQRMQRSREKLAAYIQDLETEFKEMKTLLDAAPERRRLYEERQRLATEREERERREVEERKRRQRELCDSRIAERIGRIGAPSEQPALSQSVGSRQSVSSRQSLASMLPAASRQDARGQDTDQPQAASDVLWPDDEAKRLLRILKAKPRVELRLLAWEFERSVDEVRDMVDLLKQSARTYAASKGKPVPEFAAIQSAPCAQQFEDAKYENSPRPGIVKHSRLPTQGFAYQCAGR